MNTYKLDENGLSTPDIKAFGFDGEPELYKQPDFKIVQNVFEYTRRSYNIHRLVIKHQATKRYFSTDYSIHENEGFEWWPGSGAYEAPAWVEVYPYPTTIIDYKTTPHP
jgi:hypothetical protein